MVIGCVIRCDHLAFDSFESHAFCSRLLQGRLFALSAALTLIGLFTRLIAVALANLDDLHSTLRLQSDYVIYHHILNVLGNRTVCVSNLS